MIGPSHPISSVAKGFKLIAPDTVDIHAYPDHDASLTGFIVAGLPFGINRTYINPTNGTVFLRMIRNRGWIPLAQTVGTTIQDIVFECFPLYIIDALQYPIHTDQMPSPMLPRGIAPHYSFGWPRVDSDDDSPVVESTRIIWEGTPEAAPLSIETAADSEQPSHPHGSAAHSEPQPGLHTDTTLETLTPLA